MHSAGFTPGLFGGSIGTESAGSRPCDSTGVEELIGRQTRSGEEETRWANVQGEQKEAAESDEDRGKRLRIFMDLTPDEQRLWALSEEDIEWIREQNNENDFG
jgi:hypothetical protein